MSTPKRIQIRRDRPWQTYPKAVIVDRRTKLGNPFRVGELVQITAGEELAMIPMTAQMAVACFDDLMSQRLHRDPADMPEDAAYVQGWYDLLDEIRGRDVACWCKLSEPCHGDVWLRLANPGWKKPRPRVGTSGLTLFDAVHGLGSGYLNAPPPPAAGAATIALLEHDRRTLQNRQAHRQ